MGHANLGRRAFHELIWQLQGEWHGGDYDILTRNCTHFADHLCRLITGNTIPTRLTSLADAGAALADSAENIVKRISVQSKTPEEKGEHDSQDIIPARTWVQMILKGSGSQSSVSSQSCGPPVDSLA